MTLLLEKENISVFDVDKDAHVGQLMLQDEPS